MRPCCDQVQQPAATPALKARGQERPGFAQGDRAQQRRGQFATLLLPSLPVRSHLEEVADDAQAKDACSKDGDGEGANPEGRRYCWWEQADENVFQR